MCTNRAAAFGVAENDYSQVIDNTDRERLLIKHLPQVNLIARRIHQHLPRSISLDDLIAEGTLGLIAAIDNYDASRGVKLRSYAESRIRGAILDSLRKSDWVPREQRRRLRAIHNAIDVLTNEHQRVPEEHEIADFLGFSLSQYRAISAMISRMRVGNLDRPPDESRVLPTLDFLAHGEEGPLQLAERLQMREKLTAAVARLPDKERTVLSLYYVSELNLQEIGDVLKLHSSRISQLKAQAINRLRWLLRGESIGSGRNRHRINIVRGRESKGVSSRHQSPGGLRA